MDIVRSEKFKLIFTSQFHQEIYDKAIEYADTVKFYPLQKVYPIYAVYRAMLDVETSKSSVPNLHFNYNSNKDIESLYKVFQIQRARVEIIKLNAETRDDLNIIGVSDQNCFGMPFYNSDQKISGALIESFQQTLNIKFECKTDSEVSIILRGENLKGIKTESLQAYIDYTNLSINDYKVKPSSIQNEPYVKTFNAHAGKIYNVKIDWEIHW